MHTNYEHSGSHRNYDDAEFKIKGLGLTGAQVRRAMLPTLENFLAGKKNAEIIEAVYDRVGITITRQNVYDVVRKAVERQMLFISPPRDMALEAEINKFENKGRVEVVDNRGCSSGYVHNVGAEVVYDLIKAYSQEGRTEVHIGLGIGYSTLNLAHGLAAHVRADRKLPKLVIHALSTSHTVGDPLEAPNSFFQLFTGAACEVEFVGLYAEAIVKCDDYEHTLGGPIAEEAFRRRDEIDIVVTSLGSSQDRAGYMYQYAERFGDGASIAELQERNWQGDVQLRPFSANGPIELEHGYKPVTLFELSDLVKLARKPTRHVVLLGGRGRPYGNGATSKVSALLPLLSEPSLHVWDHIVIDYATAEELAKYAPAA